MAYKIGSFNIKEFGSKKRINIDLIAKIISDEHFDIIALQEVLNEAIVRDELIPRLKGNWDYRWDTPSKSSSSAAEGYAFLWNTDTMELSFTNKIENFGGYNAKVKRVAEPHIYNQYRIDPKRGEYELQRNPYYGRFKPKDGFCELRLINTHIRSTVDPNEDHYRGLTKLTETPQRQNELIILSRVIYHNISNKVYGNNMPNYTILLGDYNLNLRTLETKGKYSYLPGGGDDLGTIRVFDNGVWQDIVTVQDRLTTLNKVIDERTGETVSNDYANNFDHFSYDKERFRGIGTRARRVNSVKKYCDNDFQKHKKQVSDHVPISLQLDLRNDRNLEWEDE